MAKTQPMSIKQALALAILAVEDVRERHLEGVGDYKSLQAEMAAACQTLRAELKRITDDRPKHPKIVDN